MKNGMLLALSCTALLGLAACTTQKRQAVPAKATASGTFSEADTVVDMHGKLTNESRFLQFYDRLTAGTPDRIRIAKYTIEGDPIYNDLDFDGKKLQDVIDATHDKFGAQEKHELVCKPQLLKKDQEQAVLYQLTECDTLQPYDPLVLALPKSD